MKKILGLGIVVALTMSATTAVQAADCDRVGQTYTLAALSFEYKSTKLTADAVKNLQPVAALIQACPKLAVSVGGHTDNVGSAGYNLKLSTQRAEAVRNVIVDAGAPIQRVAATGYGLTKPIADNRTSEGRAQNRRVELVFLSHQAAPKLLGALSKAPKKAPVATTGVLAPKVVIHDDKTPPASKPPATPTAVAKIEPAAKERQAEIDDSQDDHGEHGSDYESKIKMSPSAKIVKHSNDIFKADPSYADKAYDHEAQLAIYGGKSAVPTPRPLLELGRPQYQEGPFREGVNIFGEKNLSFTYLHVYGDWRTAVAYNDNGANDLAQIATRLNLDVDLKITATERLHAFFRPLDDKNRFTRYEFGGDVTDGKDTHGQLESNFDPVTLFFEGDLGAIWSGASDKHASWDLPFAVGLMPLLFQNGVWLEDAFTGVAFTIPARNSRLLDISNFDITFFTGFDDVTNGGFGNADEDDINIHGIATFFEMLESYIEIDYAYLDGKKGLDVFDHHNASIGFSKRFRDWFSGSFRYVATFGQNKLARDQRTADGHLLLLETSLITSKPTTYIPYLNLFAGFDRPQSAARDNGGILKNTGVNFETDALTGFPKLDDSGQDAWGGAIGINYLFNLDQQLVFELATVQPNSVRNPKGPAVNPQYAAGIRYQRPLNKAWIVRMDGMYGSIDSQKDISGIRLELRRKF